MMVIEINKLTDDQFQNYLKLLNNVRNKYDLNKFVMDYDWDDYREYYFTEYSDWRIFKKKRLNLLEESKNRSLREYILFDNENALAFTALKMVSGERYEFIYDSLYVEIPDELLKKHLEVVYKYLNETGSNSISYWTSDKIKKETFIKSGIPISYESVNSKLLKADIDFANLKTIVESNEFAKDYRLILYREISEEIHDSYIKFHNESSKTIQKFNPVKGEAREFTKERLLKMIKNDAEDGDPMYMYTLFDGENLAAICRVYIEKAGDSVFIQHCGGLTSVSEKYRGKGFAKYLKAQMYLKISEDYPNFTHGITDTFPWNKYMFRINEEFGFKILCEGSSFEFTKEFLENYLK